MACGCIPIATNVGSVSTVVMNNYNGFITKAGQDSILAEKVKGVFSMSTEQSELMRTRARQTVVQNFDSQEIWKLLIDEASGTVK